jgi:tRNA A-37 threonylcarbamoyl transferase component Bud32
MQYCNACGGENTDAAKFCSKCGAPLAAGTPPPRQPTLPLQSLLHNRYLIRKLLGQGGMGAVYLAEDQQVFNRLCVVKEMLPFYTTPAERQQAEHNFQREARLLANLRNPGLPQVYDYFTESNRYYLVMEWVEGENLEDRMARLGAPLPESEVLGYALQLASILVYMARQTPPVIHRDIKPANIILGQDDQVKLVDFGIAKATAGTGLTATPSIPLGTPGYVPPEQYSGRVEPRTDVYGLGATLHHLLTGRDPRAEAPFHFPPVRTLSPGVSPELAEILTEMLQTDMALRPTPVELRTKLESLLAPLPTAQPRPFTFRSGDVAHNLPELAAACDRLWDGAIEYLYAGDFEPWLQQWNRPDLATRAASIRRRGGDRSAGLEEFIRAVDHTMPMPALALGQTTIDLGTVERGEMHTVRVGVMNAGRGYLHGEFVAGAPWVKALPQTFGLMAGEQTTVRVTMDTSALDEGPVQQAIFEVRSNGGLEAVICKADVTWQPRLSLEPAGQLDFAPVLEGKGQPVEAVFVVCNTGGGTLEGHIATSAPWLQLDTDAFRLTSGESLTVTAVAEPGGLGIGKAQVGSIHITTPMEAIDFPAWLRMQKAWYTGWSRAKTWLVYGLLVLLGYLGAAAPLSAGLAMILGWPQPDDAILGVLLAALVLSPAAFYLSKRWISRLDEMEDYHHRGSLADELVASRFSGKKLAWLAGVVTVMGLLLGWRFADWRPAEGTAVWVLAGGLMGAITGSLLAIEGEPSPAIPSTPSWLARFWRGSTLATSSTYTILRSLALALTGGMMGLMAGTLVSGRVKPENALIGVLLGLLMSSESHRWLGARLRWLLGHARLGGWMILGSYLAATAVTLLQWRQPWTVAGYGYLLFYLPSLQGLIQLGLLIVAALVGAIGGLWAADGAGLPWARARRTFLGMTGVLAIAAFPVYLAAAILVRTVKAGAASDWIAVLAVLGESTWATWAMRARRARIEATLTQARRTVTQVWDWLKAMLPTAGQRAWKALGVTINWGRVGKRLRLSALGGRLSTLPVVSRLRGWSRPTLADLSAEMTIPLAVGAVGTTVIVQELLAKIIVGLALLLARTVLYILILFVVVVVIVLGVRYMRNR